jgi:hypothetical protein
MKSNPTYGLESNIDEVKTIDESKEHHIRKLQKLSLKLLPETPLLDEPTYEQKVWVLSKLSEFSPWSRDRARCQY